MNTIYKYAFPVKDRVIITTHELVKILKFGKQAHQADGMLTMWALVNPDLPQASHVELLVYGTGHDIPDNADIEFIDTIQDGTFVWHLFKVVPE